MKSRLHTAFFLLACLLMPACPHEQASAPMQDITLFDLTGARTQLFCPASRIMILNLWATWCAPCKAEIKHLIELHDEFKARGFDIIGLALDSVKPEYLKPAVLSMGIPYPVYACDAGEIFGKTGVASIPATLFVNSSGVIVKRLTGYHTKEELSTALEEVAGTYQKEKQHY